LPDAYAAHWRRHTRDDRLLDGEPSARKIQHQAIRLLHPGGVDVKPSLTFHAHGRAVRRLRDGNAGDHRPGRGCAGRRLCLSKRGTCRCRDAR